MGFPGGSMVKNPPTSAGDVGLVPDSGRSHMLSGNKARMSQLLSLCSGAREPRPLKPERPPAQAPQQEEPRHWGPTHPSWTAAPVGGSQGKA